MTIGEVRATFVPDGSIRLPPVPMFDGGTAELFAVNAHLLDGDGYLVMSLGSLLVESRGVRILVDLSWGPSTLDIASATAGTRRGRIVGGGLLDNLARLGVMPEDIDIVVFSHLHADHVGWLTTETPDGPVVTFRRAEHRLAEDEWTYWHGRAKDGTWGGPTPRQLDVLGPHMTTVQDGELLAPGVNVMLTPGHTPGHASLVISSDTQRALVLGDTVHCPLEISNPELALLSDVDPITARATRERIYRELDDGTVAVGGHFPELVFGRVVHGAAGRRLEYLSSARHAA
jgi:glyoxylase-like metal-dependent hydrolase (beta-lactamase superfamily II)